MTDPPARTLADRPVPPSRLAWREWRHILAATWKDAGDDNLGLVAAGVAFYAFLAFVPLLTAFVLSYGLVAEPASVVRHVQALTNIMPQNAAEIIGDQLRGMTEASGAQTGFALLLALAIALYGTSRGAVSVILALNIVFEVREARGFVSQTLVALTMAGGAVVVLVLAVLAISALNLVEALLPDLGGLSRTLLNLAFFLAAGAAVILLLAVVYRYGPNRPGGRLRWITPGSALAGSVWLAATFGFGLYVANFGNYNATYGSLGAVIVFLTWLYLTAYIVLLGAELNAVIECRARRTHEEQAQPQAAVPATSADLPSFGHVATRLGFFSMLLALLGRPRRDRAR